MPACSISELNAALDAVREPQALSSCADDDLEGAFAKLQQTAARLEAIRAVVLAEIERRGLHARSGHANVTSWIADRFQEHWGQATRQVERARALESMPETRAALAQGAISESALQQLLAAHEAAPEPFRADETALVAAARSLPAKALRVEVTRWRIERDHESEEIARRAYARRYLRVGTTALGMVRVEGELDPESGQGLIAALRAATPPPKPDDDRTPGQRCADALGEICRSWSSGEGSGRRRGDRPVLVLTADLAALLGRRQGRAQFDDAGAVGPELVRRLACDASVVRVLMGGPSEVLDVGRKTSVVPPAVWRALVVRDRGCVGPGCDLPPSWTDAHHVVHWADGGRTSLDNLLLTCRRHHRLLHEGFLKAERRGHRWRLVAPRSAGRRATLPERAPPRVA